MGHQCLSAGSPVRTTQPDKKMSTIEMSPMPFGGESCEDLANAKYTTISINASPMPFGGESCEDGLNRIRITTDLPVVTNAFRRGVL